MKTSIYIFGLLLVLSSCKTTKENTRLQTKESTSIITENHINTDSTATLEVTEVLGITIDITDSVAFVETITELSKPDSLGVQFPTRITTREKQRVVKSKSETNRARDSTAVVGKVKTLVEKADLKSETSENTTTATKTKVKTPAMLKWAIILLVLGALVFVYLILRRFGLIKRFSGKKVRGEII